MPRIGGRTGVPLIVSTSGYMSKKRTRPLGHSKKQSKVKRPL